MQNNIEDPKEIARRRGKPIKPGKNSKKRSEKKKSRQATQNKDYNGFEEPLETQVEHFY